jgi:hypothetical protein
MRRKANNGYKSGRTTGVLGLFAFVVYDTISINELMYAGLRKSAKLPIPC